MRIYIAVLLLASSVVFADPADTSKYDYLYQPSIWTTGNAACAQSNPAATLAQCYPQIEQSFGGGTYTNGGWAYTALGVTAVGNCGTGWEYTNVDGKPACRRPKSNPCSGLASQAATASGDVDVGTVAQVWRFSCLPSGVSGKGCNVIWVGDGITGISKTLLGDGKRHYYQTGHWQYDSDGSGNATECTPDPAAKFTDFQPVKKTTDGKPSINGDGTNPPACKAGDQSGYVNNKPVCLKKSTDSNGVNFGVTPETNPSNTLNKDGTVTTGNPAAGSYDEYCYKNPTSIICTSTGNGSGDGFTGDSGSGNGTGTGTGTGTASGTGTSGTGSGTGTGTTGNVNCPDCAKESTLQQVKGWLTGDGSEKPPELETAKGKGDFEKAFENADLTALAAWKLPGHQSQCPTADFQLFGKQLTLDYHCTLIQQHGFILQNVMSVVWTLAALFIVLSA